MKMPIKGLDTYIDNIAIDKQSKGNQQDTPTKNTTNWPPKSR